jgi:hypothetical protein
MKWGGGAGEGPRGGGLVVVQKYMGSMVYGGGGGDPRHTHKGVGPGMTLAWPGWKQSDIAVEVDTGRPETSRFKKCCANCVLLYFPSAEFKSAFNVY